MSNAVTAWYEVRNVGSVPSPALLVYPERVTANLQRLVAMAGGTERLRPHVKSHKMPAVVQLQLELGITRFKCATIAEAEMLAQTGAPDVLLAYPLVGPQIARAVRLIAAYPHTHFALVADAAEPLRALSAALVAARQTAEVLLDVNTGMDRSGVDPTDPTAIDLYRLCSTLPGVCPGGLHAYDGHLAESDVAQRAAHCEAAFAGVLQLQRAIENAGMSVPRIIAGGTPTFPLHLRRPAVECSPGTCVFWDFGYADRFPDLTFEFAALVLTRVVSKPTARRLCLDLGYKALAADPPQPRVKFLNLPEAEPVLHNEEHLVLETPHAREYPVGSVLYGVPRHICPTVALYSQAYVVQDGEYASVWPVTARDRFLTI